MARKDSLFDTLIAYLNSQSSGQAVAGHKNAVDNLALAHVRFVHERLEESELSSTEKARASEALNHAYAAVDPAYKGEPQYLSDFGRVLSLETEKLLRKKPKRPRFSKDILRMPIGGDSPADRQLADVARKIRDKRAGPDVVA